MHSISVFHLLTVTLSEEVFLIEQETVCMGLKFKIRVFTIYSLTRVNSRSILCENDFPDVCPPGITCHISVEYRVVCVHEGCTEDLSSYDKCTEQILLTSQH